MVSHDGEGIAILDHGSYCLQRFAYLRPSIDIVAQEDHLPSIGMTETMRAMAVVAKLSKQSGQLVVLPVDVGDKIEGFLNET